MAPCAIRLAEGFFHIPMLKAINKLRKSKGLPKLTEYDLDLPEINECRKAAGLPEIKLKERPCIVCNRPFRSFSPSHRVCDACRPEWSKSELPPE